MPIEQHSGGCQCGRIRYRIDGPFRKAGICHCRMCQKAFGSWGAALVSVPLTQFSWTRGQPGTFRSSAIVARGFCADCGTPLFMQEDGDPNIELAIGSLDHPEAAPPSEQVGVESKLSWFDALPSLTAHRTEDERTAADLVKLRTFQHPDHDTTAWPAKSSR